VAKEEILGVKMNGMTPTRLGFLLDFVGLIRFEEIGCCGL